MNETNSTTETLVVIYTEPTTVPTEGADPSQPNETIPEITYETFPPTVADPAPTVPETTQETFLEYDLDNIQETESTEETVAVLVEVKDLEQYVLDLAHVQLYCAFLLAGVMAAIALFLRFGR